MPGSRSVRRVPPPGPLPSPRRRVSSRSRVHVFSYGEGRASPPEPPFTGQAMCSCDRGSRGPSVHGVLRGPKRGGKAIGAIVSGGRKNGGHDELSCCARRCRRLCRRGGRGLRRRRRVLRHGRERVGRRRLRPAGARHSRVRGGPPGGGARRLADGQGRGRGRGRRCAAHGSHALPGQCVLGRAVRDLDRLAGAAHRQTGDRVERRAEARRPGGRRALSRRPVRAPHHPGRRHGGRGCLARGGSRRRTAGAAGRAGHHRGARRDPHDERPVRAGQRDPHGTRRRPLRQPAQRGGGHSARQGPRLPGGDDLLRLRRAAVARFRGAR
ncbi:hypothetical protein SBADM41S_07622 [Streptomyces badius]